MELEALNDAVEGFAAAGAELVAVTPQMESYSQAMIREKKLKFDILSDPGNKVGRKYGIVHKLPEDLKGLYLKFGLKVHEHNGDDSWELPMPARLIVDRKGIVRYAQINPDYTVRPGPSHTLEALRSLPAD